MNEVGLKKEQLDTPVLWVDLDLMEQNIQMLAAHFKEAQVDWRPHMKGVKIPAIAHKLIAAGAIGITCAKLGEAEVMAAAGINDILIANQIVGSQKARRLANLCRYTRVIVAVDNAHNVAELGQAASQKEVEIGVLVDVDTGMERTGTRPGAGAVVLSQLVDKTAGLTYLGVMAWEGHTLVHQDEAVKREEIEKSIGLLVETADLCRETGLSVSIVSGGGSGTYLVTPFLSGITEIQAGGALFSDRAYRSWGVQTTHSLFVRTQVTSRPTATRIIFDAGFKAMPSWIAQPQPLGIEHIKSYSSSAEHGVMKLDEPNEQVRIGDKVDFVVGYTDATLFLHDKLYGIRDNVVEVVWEIAGRGKLQ